MEENLKDRVFIFIRKNLLFVILFLAGFVFLFYGVMSFLGSSSSSDQIEINTQEELKQEDKISVDIEGAVFKPGVYEIPTSGRIKDALIAAGGLNELADRDWIAKNLNLAAKLTDGAKLYIPKVGEQVQASQNQSQSSSFININLASATDLDSLPGVGEVTAEKIINGRPYTAINDLLTKKILGAAAFEKIKDKISVN